jgi:hypothetical protein
MFFIFFLFSGTGNSGGGTSNTDSPVLASRTFGARCNVYRILPQNGPLLFIGPSPCLDKSHIFSSHLSISHNSPPPTLNIFHINGPWAILWQNTVHTLPE